MPTFSTTFASPAPPEGFEIDVDIEASRVRLTWSPSVIAPVDFAGFRVYRSLDNGLTFSLLAILTDVNDVEYEDYEAPLNTDMVYKLTQSNLDFESEAVEGGAILASYAWWVVTPGDLSLTFPITRHTQATLTSPKVDEVFSPIGRPTKLAVGDVVQTEYGQLAFRVMPDEPGKIALWKRLQASMEGALLLKATDGVIHRVQYGNMSRNFTKGGMQEISISFDGVS